MATDIAEVVGAALGLNLLFGIPLFPAGVIAGAGAFAILALQQRASAARGGDHRAGRGRRRLLRLRALPGEARRRESRQHLFVPGFSGTESILLATGIIGATVMPHVVYLHSALTQRRIVGRDAGERKKILRFEKVDVVIALSIAGVVTSR
jgi:manganese transport protein